MSIPPEYFPEWWNVNDSRTSHNNCSNSRSADGVYTERCTVEADTKYGGGRCLMGHFGRVGACSIDVTSSNVRAQCSIDRDVAPSSYCIPIHFGLSENDVPNRFDDFNELHSVARRMEQYSNTRNLPNKVLETTKHGLMRSDRAQILHNAKSISKRMSIFLQDTNVGQLIWDKRRISAALRNFDRQCGNSLLKCQEFGDSECMLLYPGGVKRDALFRVRYEKSSKSFRSKPSELKLGSPICDLDVLETHNEAAQPNIVVQTLSDLHFFHNNQNGLKEILVKHISGIVCARISPYVHGQYVVAGDSRTSLYSLELDKAIFQSNKINSLIYAPDDWCQSSFSNDLFKLLFCDYSQLRVIDARCPNENLFLYGATNMDNEKEYIVSHLSKSHLMENYQILCTNYRNCLVDQRMPERLVLEWSSALLDPPSICDTRVIPDGLSWLLTGSQNGNEVSINCYDLKHSTQGNEAPKLISVVKGGHRKHQKVRFSKDCFDRIDKSSLLGLCAIGTSDPNYVNCLQLMDNGDVFHQSFIIRSSSSEVILEFSSQDRELCGDWIAQVSASASMKYITCSSNNDVPQGFIDCCRIEKLSRPTTNSFEHCIIDLESFTSHVPTISENAVFKDTNSNFLACQLDNFLSGGNDEHSFFDTSFRHTSDDKLMKKRLTEEINKISLTIAEKRTLKERQKVRRRRQMLERTKKMCLSFVSQIDGFSSGSE